MLAMRSVCNGASRKNEIDRPEGSDRATSLKGRSEPMQPPSRPEGGGVNLTQGQELTRRMQARLFWLSAAVAVLGAIGSGLFFMLEGPRVLVLVELALLALVGSTACVTFRQACVWVEGQRPPVRHAG